MQVSTAEFKKGLKIQLDGAPYTIVDFQHVKPGKGGAFVRTKLKHMKLGRVIDNTFRAGEKVELVDFDEKRMQFLYRDERYHFMDLESYEQVALSDDVLGDTMHYIVPEGTVQMEWYDGRPVGIELPAIPAGFIHLPLLPSMVTAHGREEASMDLPLMSRAVEIALRRALASAR